MPGFYRPSGNLFTDGAKHALRPMWTEPKHCKTAEIPSGTHVGNHLEQTQNHLINYRLSGPCHWSPTPSVGDGGIAADHTGTIFIPIHIPPTRTGDDRTLALIVLGGAASNAANPVTIEWRQTFGSGGFTTLENVTLGSTEVFGEHRYPLTYTPPSGTGASSLMCIEVKITNLIVQMVSAYHLPLAIPDSDQILNGPGDCDSGRAICDDDWSFKGLAEAPGLGTVNVESMERITRRVFFNQSHMGGSLLNGAVSTDVENMLGETVFSPRCRGLLTGSSTINCIPCAVVKFTGSSKYETYIKFTSFTGSWKYTRQAGDSVVDPIFIHPWSTGSSSANGLPITCAVDDTVVIEGSVEDSSSTLTLLAWALFEGPAW